MATESWQVDAAAAETYETQMVPALFADWAPRLVAAAEVGPGDRVLDAACGTGVVARVAADRSGPTGQVTGLDLNQGMLAVARRLRPDLTWHQGDVTALPFANESFDRVLCQFGLMYIPDRVAALRELRRVVARDGTIAVAVWDAFDRCAPFVLLSELLERHVGPQAAALMRAPFVLGDLDEVVRLITAAGLHLIRATSPIGTATFPSVEAFVDAEIDGSPIAPLLADKGSDVRQQLQAEAREVFRPFGDVTGFMFPISAHIIVARPI